MVLFRKQFNVTFHLLKCICFYKLWLWRNLQLADSLSCQTSLSGWVTYLYNLLQGLKISVGGLLKTWKFLIVTSQKYHLQILSYLGTDFNTWILRGHESSVHSTAEGRVMALPNMSKSNPWDLWLHYDAWQRGIKVLVSWL